MGAPRVVAVPHSVLKLAMPTLRRTPGHGTAPLARHPRYRAAQRRDLRTAATAAGATLALVLAVDALLLGDPGPGGLLPNAIGSVLALVILLAVRRPLRRRPEVAAFAIGCVGVGVVLEPLIRTPSLGLMMLAYLVLLLVAMAMFMPWSVRSHAAWLAVSVAAVLAVVLTPIGDLLTPEFREDLMTGAIAAALTSAAGQAVLQRQRIRAFATEQQVRDLHHRSRAHEAELRRLNIELETVSRIDPLTGVGNRLRLEEDVEALRSQLARRDRHGAIALVDIDRFKRYNDTFGHLAGDSALRAVAEALKGGLRAEDGVYRFGGEEFLLLMPDTSEEEANATVARLHRLVEELALKHPENRPWGVVTFSAGVVRAEADVPADDWLRRADEALYRAKAAGRNATAMGLDVRAGGIAEELASGPAAA